MSISRLDFAEAALPEIDAPAEGPNLKTLVTWEAAEGGPSLDESWNPPQAKFNPFNTILQMPGSTNFRTRPPYVQNYISLAQGIEAWRITILNTEAIYHFHPIVHRLRENRPAHDTLRAVIASAWGTDAYVMQVLDGVRHFGVAAYGAKLIGQ